jgi:hypothetical protein
MDKVWAAHTIGIEAREAAAQAEREITIELVDELLARLASGAEGESLQTCAQLANRWTVKRFALDENLTVEEVKLGKAAASARDKARADIEVAPDPKAPHRFQWSPNRGRCKVCNGGTGAAPHKAWKAQQATDAA